MKQQNANTHVSEDALELYCLGRVEETELVTIEEHLFICHPCQDRLVETQEYLTTVKKAATELENVVVPEQSKSTWRDLFNTWSKPAWAAAGAAACLLLMVPILRETSTTPVAVDLHATRSETAASTKAGVPLTLRVDTAGIDASSAVVQVVDLNGSEKWKGALDSGNAIQLSSGLSAGQYWVRVYKNVNSQSDPIREFALSVR